MIETSVYRTRSLRRKLFAERWSPGVLDKLQGVPWDPVLKSGSTEQFPAMVHVMLPECIAKDPIVMIPTEVILRRMNINNY